MFVSSLARRDNLGCHGWRRSLSIPNGENGRPGLVFFCFSIFARLPLYSMYVTLRFLLLEPIEFPAFRKTSFQNLSVPFRVHCSQRQISDLFYHTHSLIFLIWLVTRSFFRSLTLWIKYCYGQLFTKSRQSYVWRVDSFHHRYYHLIRSPLPPLTPASWRSNWVGTNT